MAIHNTGGIVTLLMWPVHVARTLHWCKHTGGIVTLLIWPVHIARTLHWYKHTGGIVTLLIWPVARTLHSYNTLVVFILLFNVLTKKHII